MTTVEILFGIVILLSGVVIVIGLKCVNLSDALREAGLRHRDGRAYLEKQVKELESTNATLFAERTMLVGALDSFTDHMHVGGEDDDDR